MAQMAGDAGVAQFFQRAFLNLANSFAGKVEELTHFRQRVGLKALETIP